ncbi:nucleoside deaminase [Pseudarthrobacter sp. MDT3-26]|uniref:nucleoside deaminase n=1 Tax=Pseudarthrobacter raffinosi TaxID=2953651 RepID=UPI00208F34B4|nr:nucleoside deaminase [Pseudarthrobacter sp. MDT3-26]MCO4264760.1 nucleoside deaminase [Pseudarthrobacter sp. MDT3-26]
MSETERTTDPVFEAAYEAAQKSLREGGIPIGAALARGGVVIASGHNKRVQHGDPIAHGEMSALRAAGRQKSYRDTTLYTTLAPCAMCAGTIIQFKIPRVMVGEAETFPLSCPCWTFSGGPVEGAPPSKRKCARSARICAGMYIRAKSAETPDISPCAGGPWRAFP